MYYCFFNKNLCFLNFKQRVRWCIIFLWIQIWSLPNIFEFISYRPPNGRRKNNKAGQFKNKNAADRLHVCPRSYVPNAADVSRDGRCRWFRFDRAAAEPGPAVPQRLPEPADPDVHQPRLLHSARIRLPAAYIAVARAQLHQPTATSTVLDTRMCSDVFLKYPRAPHFQLLCENYHTSVCGFFKRASTGGGYKRSTSGRGRKSCCTQAAETGVRPWDVNMYCPLRPSPVLGPFLFYVFARHTTLWFENKYLTWKEKRWAKE